MKMEEEPRVSKSIEYQPRYRIKDRDRKEYWCNLIETITESEELKSEKTDLLKLRKNARQRLLKKLKRNLEGIIIVEEQESINTFTYHDNTYDEDMTSITWECKFSAYRKLEQ